MPRVYCSFVGFLLLFCLVVGAGRPTDAQTHSVTKPKLILLLVVDQFSYDYLTRFQDKFSAKGIRYLQDHGANFTNCRFGQANTVTASGHSVISTGAYPWATGIIGNAWFDRKKNAVVEAVDDDTVQLVGTTGPGKSARAMLGTTFGDQLRLASNGRSRVFVFSLKDRSALLLAGKLANGAYWYDDKSGNFISSSQWGAQLPAWLMAFNDQRYAARYFGKSWQRLLPEAAYNDSTRDDYMYEGNLPGGGKQFPHTLTGSAGSAAPDAAFFEMFEDTPFADEMLVDLAKTAIDQEAIGSHADTDLLCLSFSATDSIGHIFGPYSQEAEDTVLRLDLSIARLLAYVDEKVGLNHCIVVMTGDHGVAPIPEFLKERGQLQGLDAGRIDPQAFKTLLNSALSSRLGAGEWVSAFVPPNLYLNLSEIDRMKYRQPEVEALAAKLAHAVPGVAYVYTAAQFYNDQLPVSPFTAAVKRSYFAAKSGELYVVARPGYIFSGTATGTTHGSPYAYDAQVPLILCGPGIAAGRFGTLASPCDIAPTVSAIVGIQMPPMCEGRVLTEALAQPTPPVVQETPPPPPVGKRR